MSLDARYEWLEPGNSPPISDQGQGGAQAIEDGEALGAFFEAVVSPASLEVVNTVLKVCMPLPQPVLSAECAW